MSSALEANDSSSTRSGGYVCDGCTRALLSSGALVTHRMHCDDVKRKMDGLLNNVSDAMLARRKRILASKFEDSRSQSHASLVPVLHPPSALPALPEPLGPPALPALPALPEPLGSPAVPEPPPSLPEPAATAAIDNARPRRENIRLPARYRDNAESSRVPRARKHVDTLPEPLISTSSDLVRSDPTASSLAIRAVGGEEAAQRPHVEAVPARTKRNVFGLYRQYRAERLPTHDPEAAVDRELLLDPVNDSTGNSSAEAATLKPCPPDNAPSTSPLGCPEPAFVRAPNVVKVSPEPGGESDCSLFHPYPNWTSFRLGQWYWSGSPKKSESTFKDLLDILTDPRFCARDLTGVNWKRINEKLLMGETCPPASGSPETLPDDWHKSDIEISVPVHSKALFPGVHLYDAATLCHRKIMPMIQSRVTDPSVFPHLHLEPYELFWKANSAKPIRVHGEVYTSPTFIEAHDALQRSPPEPGCTRQRVVIALMFSSDGTHLTEYGDAKLHPLYAEFGNESKERRSKQSNGCFEHMAYFESLPDAFKDFVKQKFGKNNFTGAFATHCNRELFHAQWEVLLDEEFLEAYEHGIVILCPDGVERRFYPRIFSYSADYPEKVLLAGIRNLGRCPCPRCLIPLDRAHNLGMPRDRTQRKTLARLDNVSHRLKVESARRMIYDQQRAVTYKGVEGLLFEESLVPTTNAFSKLLGPLGLNVFDILTVDFLHEYELGVWKSILIHILRLLDAADPKTKDEFDRRCRLLPPFGRDIIRRIFTNRSELKRMTAHEYGELLKCAIPLFEDLLPEPHNTRLCRLLFTMAYWHGFGGLHLHTDATTDILDALTTLLGQRLRNFKITTCAAYVTRELKREAEQRQRREAKSKSTQLSTSPVSGDNRHLKTLNLDTFKLHALGDYVSSIRTRGTTDSYSTRLTHDSYTKGESEHKLSKSRYQRTSGKDIAGALSKVERRQRTVRAIRNALSPSHLISLHRRARARKERKMDPMFSPKVQYSIGANEASPVDIPTFLSRNHGDPAVLDFLAKLRSHLLPRIVEVLKQEQILCPDAAHPAPTTTATDNGGENQIYIHNDRMYHHKKVSFSYTTHDVRRGQDIINCGTPNHNIMLLSSTTFEDEASSSGRFLYARVLGAYHVNVVYTGPGMLDYKPRRIDFLWVRWYHVQRAGTTSWKNSELPMVAFPPLASESAFGFVDPSDVLRACHIIPAFARGQVHRDGIGLSGRARDGDDYKAYYVGCFCDSDTLMRYHWGMGIGHIHAHGLADAKSLPSVNLFAGVEVEVEVEVEPEANRNAGPTEEPLSDGRTGGEEEPDREDPTMSGDVDDDPDSDMDDDDEDLDDTETPEIDDDLDDALYPGL